MKYQNTSMYSITIRGVEFKPHEIKEVSGYINRSDFIRIDENSNGHKSSTSTSNKKLITSNMKKGADIDG